MGRVRSLLAGPVALALLAATGIYFAARSRREDANLDLNEEATAAPSATPRLLSPLTSLWHRVVQSYSAPRRREGAGEERGPLPIFLLRDGAGIRQTARDLACASVGKVAEWKSSERARQIAWDVVDACASSYLGDMPRSNIVPRALYSTLTREAKSWWQRQQQGKGKPSPSPSPAAAAAAAQNGGVDAAAPQQPGGGGDAVEELKGLLTEVGQLRAEVRQLRAEMDQLRAARVGEVKLQKEHLLPWSCWAADPDGSSQPPAAEW